MLETQRLLLRRYCPEDAPAMLELVAANRDQLIREFAAQAGLRTIPEAEAFIALKGEAWNARKTFCYRISEKNTNAQVGQIQVKNVDWDIPAAELGYFIAKSAQRQGYGSEAIQRVLDCAFQDLSFQRIFVRILLSNDESFRLARKAGFREEGVHRNAFRCGLGELHDVRYLSLTPADYLLVAKETQIGP